MQGPLTITNRQQAGSYKKRRLPPLGAGLPAMVRLR